ncbi:MarR family winged helix-turn-helix transcriptional regulator [Sphingomonas mesophila]|uniref:MarR family winged helix-turn-helix transcriptional regulator n=1 Tax=Sphingomonas mesophila TaxID=2303576 RepID=UPI000E591E50|nr:MarR family transcriptional regulator [Sphingomonas mesophila]
MLSSGSPTRLAERFALLVERLGGDTASARTTRQQRDLLEAVRNHAPATLKSVAAAVGRGEPAVSRAIDSLVRAGMVDRAPDPANRRRLALRLAEAGQQFLERPPAAERGLEARLTRLAQSELRALERAFEILERLPR